MKPNPKERLLRWADDLDAAHRFGPDGENTEITEDYPEGTLHVRLSSTLAYKLAYTLRTLADELVVSSEDGTEEDSKGSLPEQG